MGAAQKNRAPWCSCGTERCGTITDQVCHTDDQCLSNIEDAASAFWGCAQGSTIPKENHHRQQFVNRRYQEPEPVTVMWQVNQGPERVVGDTTTGAYQRYYDYPAEAAKGMSTPKSILRKKHALQSTFRQGLRPHNNLSPSAQLHLAAHSFRDSRYDEEEVSLPPRDVRAASDERRRYPEHYSPMRRGAILKPREKERIITEEEALNGRMYQLLKGVQEMKVDFGEQEDQLPPVPLEDQFPTRRFTDPERYEFLQKVDLDEQGESKFRRWRHEKGYGSIFHPAPLETKPDEPTSNFNVQESTTRTRSALRRT